jgi:hypothetical protein
LGLAVVGACAAAGPTGIQLDAKEAQLILLKSDPYAGQVTFIDWWVDRVTADKRVTARRPCNENNDETDDDGVSGSFRLCIHVLQKRCL